MKIFRNQTFLLSLAVALLSAGAGFTLQLLVNDKPVPRGLTGEILNEKTTLVGKPAPDFRLPSLNGTEQTMDEWRGRIRVINFWATWCPPCKREMPALMKFHSSYSDTRGLVVVGIAIDERRKVRDFVEELGVQYPVLVEEGSGIELMNAFGNPRSLLPQTVIVDREGVVVASVLGEVTFDQLEDLIKDL